MTPGPVLTCAFCGEEYPTGTPATQHEALTAHVYACKVHPLGQIVRDLAMGIRKLKAYPQSREKTIDGLLDYINRCGFGGNPLR